MKAGAFSTFILVGGAYFVRMLAGLLINKLLAVYVGASGIALLGQFKSLTTVSTGLSTAGINNGVIKLIAENSSDDNSYKVINTSVLIICVASFLISFGLFLFSGVLSESLFSNAKYTFHIKLFSISVVFFALNQLCLLVINGKSLAYDYAILNIFQSISILIMSVFFVYLWGLEGAFVVIAIGQIGSFVFSVELIRRKRIVNFKNIKVRYDSIVAGALFKFSLVSIVNALCVSLSVLFIRTLIISGSGIDAAGHWQAVWQASDVYLGLITMFFSVYFYPKICACVNNPAELNRYITLVFSGVLFFASLLLVGINYFRDAILLLLYTEDFLEASEIFSYQLIGDFFKMLSWVFGYVMLARSMVKTIIFSTIASNLIFSVSTYFLLEKYGVLGVSVGHIINYCIFFVFSCSIYFVVSRGTFERESIG
jgi:polysaccharide transporter, PST family